jgi:hypothetical protein
MKTSEYPIEIPLSKYRLVLLLISAIAFVSIGIWFVSKPESFKNGLLGNPTIVLSIGILAIAVFGLSGFVIAKKLLDNTPGLIIDETGITDNSSGVSAGYIPWETIESFTPAKVFSQKFLTVILKKPEGSVRIQKNDSPINITVSSLQCNFDELEKLLKKELKKYKSR